MSKQKPILFNTEMVKAILEGRKTQTRRVLDKRFTIIPFNGNEEGYKFSILDKKTNSKYDTASLDFFHAYGFSKYKTGDILWVRETFCYDSDGFPVFKAGFIFSPYFDGLLPKWKPPMHLKKEDARIFLKVTNVRVERLQNISKEDAINEGIKKHLMDMWLHYENLGYGFSDKDYDLQGKSVNGAICSFRTLWNSTTKFNKGIRKSQNDLNKYSWEDNPYVFVYEFEVIRTHE